MNHRRRRPMGATTLAVAAAAAGALVLPATGASAVFGVQDDRMTIASPVEDLKQRVNMVRGTNSRVARFDILWSEVAPTKPDKPHDPRDPAYDWTRADIVINLLHRAGITPIVSVYSTPGWAVQGTPTPFESQYNPNAPNVKQFAFFMRAVATRYQRKARHFEVWNEPNLRNFLRFRDKANPVYYKQMLRVAYPNIKAGNRRAIVIAGVGGPRSSTGGGSIGARAWMNAILRERGLRFDAYSQHIYPSQGPRFRSARYNRVFPTWNSIPEIHRALNRKRPGMKLYITEAGYTTQKTPFRNVRVTPRQQNLYLRQMATLPAVRSPQTAAVIWFNLQDNVNWPAGLVYENGRAKPAYRTFRKIANRPIPRALRVELNRRLR